MPLRYLSDNCRYSWYLPPSWCPVCPVISKWYINAAANYNNLLVETKKENCHTMWKVRIQIDIHEICGKQTKVMISFISMDTKSCTLALKLETANIKPVPEISWFFRDAPPRQLRPKPGQGEGGGVNARGVKIRGVNCWRVSREVKVPFNGYHSSGASLKSSLEALLRNHLYFIG